MDEEKSCIFARELFVRTVCEHVVLLFSSEFSSAMGMFCMHGCLVSHVLLMSCGKVGVSNYSLPTPNVMEPGPAVLTEVFRDYPQSLQTDARIVPYS
jgi:hypothetical protein